MNWDKTSTTGKFSPTALKQFMDDCADAYAKSPKVRYIGGTSFKYFAHNLCMDSNLLTFEQLEMYLSGFLFSGLACDVGFFRRGCPTKSE